jgi:hypothetical protein
MEEVPDFSEELREPSEPVHEYQVDFLEFGEICVKDVEVLELVLSCKHTD